ncbi:hypothetical protein GPECTOR_2g1221 [Gonium pectorale]|uniref:Uncharacterized protein n=1 Tax=Gonium pectorale TaxID=33097 RepID=A0A150H0R1_GONPE|nr:hypothetical protein GPECTOR_2g1221 [Gonium pectorale]|eukprot:KXZ55671.1 hypothetical protein GPECTOR_2g1221 [Gonium pectorale]
MLYSHTNKLEDEVLKPRNACVIAISDNGRLDLRHEGILPECKADEEHEYFTIPQFDEFASGCVFDYTPPEAGLLLLVRHGVAVNNVNKAYMDGGLTPEGKISIVKAGLRIQHILEQHGAEDVHIFSSALLRTQHSSALLYEILGHRHPLASSRSLPCIRSCSTSDNESEAAWMKGAVPIGV